MAGQQEPSSCLKPDLAADALPQIPPNYEKGTDAPELESHNLVYCRCPVRA